MRKLLLALAFAAASVNAAAGHAPKNINAVMSPVIVAQQEAITSLPSSPGLTIALVLPINAGGVVGRAAVGIDDECRNMQTNAANDKDARFVLYGTDGKASSSAGAYQQAIKDGANIIIGPLLRTSVAALLRQYKDAPVPTLLLQPGGGDNFFFITAEAGREAAALAEIINAAGATEVLIVPQQSELAKRQMRGFINQWQTINNAAPDIFRINNSNDDSRWQSLFDLLRDAAEDEKRMAVFAAGDAAFSRRVRHYAPSYHPVFAGSFSYDRAAFADDIYMMAMPAMLTPPEDDTSAIVRRFRALGNDACFLALQADKWEEGFDYEGKSGDIVLIGNEFKRRGVLARQSGGNLQKALPPPFVR